MSTVPISLERARRLNPDNSQIGKMTPIGRIVCFNIEMTKRILSEPQAAHPREASVEEA